MTFRLSQKKAAGLRVITQPRCPMRRQIVSAGSSRGTDIQNNPARQGDPTAWRCKGRNARQAFVSHLLGAAQRWPCLRTAVCCE